MIVKFFEWDQPKNIENDLKDIENGDILVVEHEWGGLFLAKVLIKDQSIEKEEFVGRALRKAEFEDKGKICENREKEIQLTTEIKKIVREKSLEMKIFETKISIDEKCLVIAFIAEGRVDFREIVRDLSAKYQKTIRFQQIGSRDEARQIGGYGICGRELCCKKFPGSLKSITTEMARCQMVSHRGTERISGACGRLMCCLGFEADQYAKILEEMPKRGDKIKRKGEEVTVIDLNPISKTIKAKNREGVIITIKSKEIINNLKK